MKPLKQQTGVVLNVAQQFTPLILLHTLPLLWYQVLWYLACSQDLTGWVALSGHLGTCVCVCVCVPHTMVWHSKDAETMSLHCVRTS